MLSWLDIKADYAGSFGFVLFTLAAGTLGGLGDSCSSAVEQMFVWNGEEETKTTLYVKGGKLHNFFSFLWKSIKH